MQVHINIPVVPTIPAKDCKSGIIYRRKDDDRCFYSPVIPCEIVAKAFRENVVNNYLHFVSFGKGVNYLQGCVLNPNETMIEVSEMHISSNPL